MIAYRACTVYVVANAYPTIGSVADILAAATRADLDTANLGVLKDGVLYPLSEHERAEIKERA
jgi:hypothetical protein